MILVVHGFNSCAARSAERKAALERIFPGRPVVVLDYPSDRPAPETFALLRAQASEAGADAAGLLVGFSLGGFWASRLAARLGAGAALFNPCHTPSMLLRQFLGPCPHFCTGETWEFTPELLESYREIETLPLAVTAVAVARGDEVIPFAGSMAYYARWNPLAFEGGHSVPDLTAFAEFLRAADARHAAARW